MSHVQELLPRKPHRRRDLLKIAATAPEVASLPAVGAVPAMGAVAGKAREDLDQVLQQGEFENGVYKALRAA